MTTPTDPLYSSQWHFGLIGDIEAVWDDYTGSGINVLIMDDGVEFSHEDLNGNYDGTNNFYYKGTTYDGLPSSGSSEHGTSVAGLIGAERNGLGGVGVSYDVNLTSFDFLLTIQYDSDYGMTLAAYEQSANFDVVNNSYGLTAAYADFDPSYSVLGGTSGYYYVYSYINVLAGTLETGRNGLGTVSLYAAGNDGMNCSGSYLTNNRASLVVAATNSSGNVKSYSNYGVSLMVAAPAGSDTTDRTGSLGYSSGDYTSSFGGTSAATPITAGVVALILDANENLGWRDVNDILSLSAQQTGSTFGAASSGYEYGTWISNGASNWNGGGLTYHLSYGYGMIDAYAATRLAEVWDILYDNTYATSANEQSLTLNYSGSSRSVSDGGSNSISIATTDHFEIDSAYVTVDLSSYDMESLTVYLVTPDGDQMMLLDQENIYLASQGSLYNYSYTFHVNGLNGMDSSGSWQLRVVDNDSDGYTTKINDFSVEFFGDSYDINDVYHFTKDFAELAAAESNRLTISDSNGGTDWLNFVMLTDGVRVSLVQDQIRLGGNTVTLGHQNFENVMAGQGNDIVIGDGTNNYLVGADGNDRLRGRGGDDQIDGGTGHDRLLGENGLDLIHGGDGSDKIYGGNGKDKIYGDRGNDVIYGETSNDSLYGGTGNDTIYGGDGWDRILAGSGNDSIDGGNGRDKLYGGAGKDRIIAGEGNDQIYGGSDADTFVFDINDDTDVIHDYERGLDTLEFTNEVAASVAEAMDHASIVASNVVFDFQTVIITLEGVTSTTGLAGDILIV